MKRPGVGVASAWQGSNYHYGAVDNSTISLELTSEPRLRVGVAAADLGQGSNETICQIISDAFCGFPIYQIDFIDPDTAVTPDGGATGASRFTEVAGSAALKAAQKLISALQLVASEMLDTPPQDIRIEGIRAYGGDGSFLRLTEVVEAAKNNTVIGQADFGTGRSPISNALAVVDLVAVGQVHNRLIVGVSLF